MQMPTRHFNQGLEEKGCRATCDACTSGRNVPDQDVTAAGMTALSILNDWPSVERRATLNQLMGKLASVLVCLNIGVGRSYGSPK